jgi:hypothetical protein
LHQQKIQFVARSWMKKNRLMLWLIYVSKYIGIFLLLFTGVENKRGIKGSSLGESGGSECINISLHSTQKKERNPF